MVLVFIPSECILHPETRQVLVYPMLPYLMEEVAAWNILYGIDNVKGTIQILN